MHIQYYQIAAGISTGLLKKIYYICRYDTKLVKKTKAYRRLSVRFCLLLKIRFYTLLTRTA